MHCTYTYCDILMVTGHPKVSGISGRWLTYTSTNHVVASTHSEGREEDKQNGNVEGRREGRKDGIKGKKKQGRREES